jgi:predicted small secreted protein
MFRKALITLAIGSIMLATTACNTVRGAGRDLESVATKTQEAIN